MGYQLYDRISTNYAEARREDPRIAAPIHRALGDATTVVNVGAGTGNYEPRDRKVIAVEPSLAMISQRTGRSSLVVQGVAEALPVRSDSADVAMAVLTLHHWGNLDAGLREMARVAPRQVIFLFDAAETNRFWAMEYFPEALALPSEQRAPDVERLGIVLDITDCQPVPIPIDCTDGIGMAYWGRPEAYLDPAVQQGMSWLAQLPAPVRAVGTARLADDLRSGRWDDRFGHLRSGPAYELGYKLVTTRRRPRDLRRL
jgi:SAM-dependent methyltransferase